MKISAIAIWILMGFMVLTLGFAQADEPGMPRVDRQFSLEKEQRINQLQSLSQQAVFEAFESSEFFDEEDYLNKAIFRAFSRREAEAVQSALKYVQSTQIQTSVEDSRDLYIAKRIMQVFPAEALDSLLDLYTSSGPKIRGNVIYVVGQMAGGQAVKNLLIEALNDTTNCQDMLPESVGAPLRICDAAYNQLVLRYDIKDTLRVIGTAHKINVRDYHIKLLQSRF